MRIEMAREGATLFLGRRGENRAREIRFDLSEWRGLYGPGTVQLLNQRCGESTPYPCALTVEGDTASWVVQAVDVAKPGRSGCCELVYIVGDQIAKSERWATMVLDSLGEGDCCVPPWNQSWVDQVLRAGAEASEAAKRAEDAADRAESGGGGGVGTMDHAKLVNREDPDQHPIGAITALTESLDARTTREDVSLVIGETMAEITNQEILKIWNGN